MNVRLSVMVVACLSFGTLWAKPVKYVFLFIGDGLSVPQRMAAEEFVNKTENKKLRMNYLPHQAITTTRASNSFITDSAASGTAIACGVKTVNGCIGLDETRQHRLESVTKVAQKQGKRVGIVSSVTINHATPASFYAHQSHRGNMYEIGLDLVASNFDYFAGGGVASHDNKRSSQYRGDIYDLAQKAGYQVINDATTFRALKPQSGKILARFADGAMPYKIDRKQGDVTLAEITTKGIELLDNEHGFFLMVEGGMIDWMCHANDAGTVLHEVIEFSDAVDVGYAFAQKYPDETLLVVTGDHETGGLTLGFGGTGYSSHIEKLRHQTCSQGVLVKRLKAVDKPDVTFDQVKPILEEGLGLHFTSDRKHPMYVNTAETKRLVAIFDDRRSNWEQALAIEAIKTLNNKASLGWTTGAHTALPALTTAYGIGSDAFVGMLDNTDIAKILKRMIVDGPKKRQE